jgi:hypothetical protein
MQNLFKILFIIFLFNNIGCAVNANYIEREETSKVISTGYGDSPSSSLNDAFGEAVRKAFGSKVNSLQRVENRVLVSDEINITDAERDSRITKYRILEQSQKGDIYTTKIEALVVATHLTEVSSQRRMIREEWNSFVSGPNPIVGIGQVGMKIGGEIKNYWISWFGKPIE